MSIKTHIGAELDLEHYKGKSISDFEFEMLDDNNVALDLTVYSKIVLELYSKRGGTLIKSFDTNSNGLSKSVNIISWDAVKTWVDSTYIGLTYYHHCYGVLSSNSEEDLLFYGNSEVS